MTQEPILEEIAADDGDDCGRPYVAEIRRSRDEVLETHGHGDLALYERLLSDDQVHPTFHQRRAAVVSREWRVEPGGATALDAMAADSLRDQLTHLSWDRTTYRMLAAIMYGFGVAEAMYEPDGLRVRLAGLRVRRSRRFAFDRTARLRLRDGDSYLVLPDQKFWTMTVGAESDDEPYGKGLGHFLYWPVWFKRNAIRFWAVFIEKFAMGVPMADVPPGTSKEERDKILGLLEHIRAGGKLVKSSNIAIEVLQAVKDSGGDYERFVTRMDGSIAKVVLTQTMTTDDGSSMAQAIVHERMGSSVAKSDADYLCESFMVGPAKWLTEWNYPGAATPKVYRDFTAQVDLAAASATDVALAGIGYRPTAQRVRDVYGEGYEYSPPPATPPAFAESSTIREDASQSTADLLTNWRDLLGPEVERIEELLGECHSLEEVRARLDELTRSDPDTITEALSRALFTANVTGQLDNSGSST